MNIIVTDTKKAENTQKTFYKFETQTYIGGMADGIRRRTCNPWVVCARVRIPHWSPRGTFEQGAVTIASPYPGVMGTFGDDT